MLPNHRVSCVVLLVYQIAVWIDEKKREGRCREKERGGGQGGEKLEKRRPKAREMTRASYRVASDQLASGEGECLMGS